MGVEVTVKEVPMLRMTHARTKPIYATEVTEFGGRYARAAIRRCDKFLARRERRLHVPRARCTLA
jgi:hypothetical protein